MTQENTQDSLSAALQVPPRRTLPQPAFVLALVAILTSGGVWLYQQNAMEQLKADLASQLANSAKLQQELRANHSQMAQLQQKLQVQVETQAGKLAESESRQEVLTGMYDMLMRTESVHTLAELEQMLTFASQQLQLSGDVNLALMGLSNIDQQLSRLNRPELIGVRQAITRDMDTLKALPYLDVVGVTTRLDSLISKVDTIPLLIDEGHVEAEKHQPTAKPESAVRAFLSEIWHEFRQLIQIRRMDKPEAALLTPEQSFFLRENIKLRLLSARSSVLQRNEVTFRSDISAVKQYLKDYFDAQMPATQSALHLIAQLEEQQVSVALPDLSASLTAVRSARTSAERVKP
ncbi:uroporphyrinogen-III C-methyltransferase [Chitinibacter sp. SCUT-21]|uniref:uroporphyrinogen-III C-methyltransferase n=1 Tax=Chitinibacter sp. SCUT-21 TaxID=2970891 RepID=UPI0035A5A27E